MKRSWEDQGCGAGVARSRRFLGAVRLPRTLEVEVGFFLSVSDSGRPIELFFHRTPKLESLTHTHACWNDTISFGTFILQKVLAVHCDFHWLLVATKLLTAKLHSLHVKEADSEILEAVSWSQTFNLRICNPGKISGNFYLSFCSCSMWKMHFSNYMSLRKTCIALYTKIKGNCIFILQNSNFLFVTLCHTTTS